MPSQHELFLDPQKQRSRIAFHPPVAMSFHLQTWHWETVGTSLRIYLGPTSDKKTNPLPISPSVFFVLPTLLYLHVSQPHCMQRVCVFPHSFTSGTLKNVLYSALWPLWLSLVTSCKVVNSLLLRGQPDRMFPLRGTTFCELNSLGDRGRTMKRWPSS